MAFVDPLSAENVQPPSGKAEQKVRASRTGYVDPLQQSVTTPQGEQGRTQFIPPQGEQTQFIPQSADVKASLELAKNVLAEKSGLSDFSIERATEWENVKPALIAAGAVAGGIAGTPADVVTGPGGTMAGAALGAGMARAAIGAVEREPIPEQLTGIAEEMRNEALFTGGAIAIGPAFKMLGPKIGKIFGLDDAGIKQLVRDAEHNKVPIALQDVVGEASKRTGKLAPSVAAAFPKVVGVFPFVATPQRRAGLKTASALEESVNRNLNTMAPNVTMNKLGVDMFEAAQNANSQFKGIANGLYENFYRLSDELGQPKIIPTSPIKQAIDNISSMQGRPLVTRGGKEVALKPPKIARDFDNYIRDLSGLGDEISPAEIRAIEEDINRFSDAANVKGFDVKKIAELKQGLEIAKNSMDVSRATDPQKAMELKEALDTANQWYAAGMSLFKSPAGKKFEKVDKNIFNSKFFKQGEITADQLGPVIVKAANSPQMIRDFRNIVGQSKLIDVSREVIDQARNRSVKDGVLSFYDLERNLKLDTREGVEVMDELLKGSGLNREKLQSLINVGKIHGNIDISDASTFLKRRLLLGGIGTAGLLTQPKKLLTVAVPGVLMLRGGSKFLASPNVLRWMTTSLDDTANDKVRRVAASQLIQAYRNFQLEEGEEQ